MNQLKTVVVTGSNKGLGLGIVEQLAKKNKYNIIMACRSLDKGNQAINQVLSKYKDAQISLELLDVSDSKSIDQFVGKMKHKKIMVDVLMNNAGVAGKRDDWGMEVFDFTFKTNFYGTMQLTQKMIPIMPNNGKIIIMGSSAGRTAFMNMKSEEFKNKFKSQSLSKDQLINFMKQFRARIQDNTFQQKGWPKSIYGMSKLGINLYGHILSKSKQVTAKGIQIYSMCPGYVKTDMTGGKGNKDIQEGVQTAIYLIQLPFKIDNKYQGEFFQNCKLSSTFQNVQNL